MSSVPPPNWKPSSMPATEAPALPSSAGHRRPTLIATLVVVGLAVGGAFALFGSSSTKLTDPVAQAATLSSDSAGYRMHMSLDFSSPGVPPATGIGDGTVDLRDHLAAASVSLNFAGSPAATQALGGRTLTIDQILDGSTMYMKLPAAAMPALGAAGRPWVKFDLGMIGRLRGLSSLRSNPETSDPSQLLRSLRRVSSSVVAEGQQQVDGFETTLYHVNLNLDQIAKSLPASDQAIAQGALEQGLGVHTLPIDVWVDAGHLVRRMRINLNTSLDGQTVTFGMTMDISDYGPQSRPALPPASDVQDLSALAAAG